MGVLAQVHTEPSEARANSAEQLFESSLHRRSGECVAFEDQAFGGNDEQGTGHVQNTVSGEIQKKFKRFGMPQDVLDGWAQYHVNPCVAIAYHFAAQLAALATTIYLLSGAPYTRLYYSVPYTIGIILQLGQVTLAWRLGPNLTAKPIIHHSYPGTALGGPQYASSRSN